MKIGDYIRYRERIESDPEMSGDPKRDGWGDMGIVMTVSSAVFHGGVAEPAVEFMDSKGDMHLARVADVEILSTLEDEEAMWRTWGEI